MIMSGKKLLTGALLAAILTAFIPIKVLASDFKKVMEVSNLIK